MVRKFVFAAAPVVLILAGLVTLAIGPRPAAVCDRIADDDFTVNFGLSREPITRTLGLTLPGGPTEAEPARQVTAALQGDLVRDGTVASFPADQITVSATVNGDNRTVEIRAVVDPFGANPVAEGCYRGTLTVVRTGVSPRTIDVVVDLADREKWSAAVAFAILLFGALIGLSIKWITESLTPVAESRRSFRRLLHVLERQSLTDNDLPAAVRQRRDDVEQYIKDQDITDLKEKFKQLESDLETAMPVIRAIRQIRNRIEVQTGKLDELWKAGMPEDAVNRLGRLLELEIEKLNDVRLQPDTEKVNTLKAYVDAVDRFFDTYRNYVDRPEMTVAHHQLTRTDIDNALTTIDTVATTEPTVDLAKWNKRTESRAWPTDTKPAHRSTGRDGWLFRYFRLIAAFVSALVVAFIGFSVEYLNNPAFEDNMDDWLNLFLWAAVIELSGVSVLDVVAKLSVRPSR